MSTTTSTLPAELAPFLPSGQRLTLADNLGGEEGAFFADMLAKLALTLATMPRSYGTDKQGDAALVPLHYFSGNSDWYIIELDAVGDGRQQAFGLTVLNGDQQNAGLGYISIEELVDCGVELDLYWAPITLADVKAKLEAK